MYLKFMVQNLVFDIYTEINTENLKYSIRHNSCINPNHRIDYHLRLETNQTFLGDSCSSIKKKFGTSYSMKDSCLRYETSQGQPIFKRLWQSFGFFQRNPPAEWACVVWSSKTSKMAAFHEISSAFQYERNRIIF